MKRYVTNEDKIILLQKDDPLYYTHSSINTKERKE